MVALTTWTNDVKLLDRTGKVIGEVVSFTNVAMLRDMDDVYLDRLHVFKKIKINDCFYLKATSAPKNKVYFMKAIKVTAYRTPTTLKTENPKKPVYMYQSVGCKILGNVERLTKGMLRKTV